MAGQRVTDRLGVRLAAVMTLALLPVLMMAVVQSGDILAEARARSEAALAGETLRAVQPELSRMKLVQGLAEGLAGLAPTLRPAEPGCATRLVPLVRTDGSVRFAGFYDREGRALCATPDAPDNLAGTAALAKVQGQTGTEMALLRFDGAGASGPDWATVTLLPMAALGQGAEEAGAEEAGADFVMVAARPVTLPDVAGLGIVVFDKTGAVLSANLAPDAAMGLVPADTTLAALFQGADQTFTARAATGDPRAYSVVTLVEGEISALGTWPAGQRSAGDVSDLPPAMLPAVIWIVSLGSAWLAAEFLVLRHIRRMGAAIAGLAQGQRRPVQMALRGAPREIRDVGIALETMAVAIMHEEARLEDAIHQKEALLREVHHRVKNNLQLIASIVNLQIRRTQSAEARDLMRALQDRMLSLATVHNGLYQTQDLSRIDACDLLEGIVAQVLQSSPDMGLVEVRTEFAPLTINMDQAVPLALLLAEAMGAAIAHAARTDAGWVEARLTAEPADEVRLTVTNSIDPALGSVSDPLNEGGPGLGTQLLRAFTRQLDGLFSRSIGNGRCEVRIDFAHRTTNPG